MNIKIDSEQELIKIAQEAIRIIVNLRHSTTRWEESYGVELKNKKKNWEKTADEFILKLQAPVQNPNKQIKIEIND